MTSQSESKSEQNDSDSEHSYVYCSYPVRDMTDEDERRNDAELLIIELRRKIVYLQHERDMYKKKASFMSKIIGKRKQVNKKSIDSVSKNNIKWTSMANKQDWI